MDDYNSFYNRENPEAANPESASTESAPTEHASAGSTPPRQEPPVTPPVPPAEAQHTQQPAESLASQAAQVSEQAAHIPVQAAPMPEAEAPKAPPPKAEAPRVDTTWDGKNEGWYAYSHPKQYDQPIYEQPKASYEQPKTGYEQTQPNYGQYGQQSHQNAYGQSYGHTYGQQAAQGAQPAYGQHGSTYGQYGYGTQYGAQTQPPRQKKRSKAPGIIAMLLACGLIGYGGGWAAVSLYGNQLENKETVVYQAVEPGQSADPASTTPGLSDIAEAAGESVVSITTENVVADFTLGGRIVSGAGSGVIISEDGTIITNHHVIDGASKVTVTLPDGTEYEATLVGSDKLTDIAVIKINATGLKPVVIGDSDSLRVGEFCMAIGNPLGTLGGTVTDGIISALNRDVVIDNVTMNLLQMSAAVSPGNSGGGLFNAAGELVGIVNAKSGDSEAEGLGFAIPVNTAMSVAETLITDGQVVRPALGVSVETFLTEEAAAQVGLTTPGTYVASLTEGGGAQRAGVQVGDRIISVDGVEIEDGEQLSTMIKEKSVGDTVTLVLERGGRQMEVSVTLGQL